MSTSPAERDGLSSAARQPPTASSASEDLAALLARWEPGQISAEQLLEMQRQVASCRPSPRSSTPAGPDRESAGSPRAAERVVSFRPRSVLVVLGVLMAVAAAIAFVFLASAGLTLIAIAVFLALALNPVVEFFQHRGFKRHWAVAAVYTLALAVLALVVLVFVRPLVAQVTLLIHATPDFVTKLSQGTGPAGFLERNYHVIEWVQGAVTGQGSGALTGAAVSGLGVIKGVATSIVGMILIAFLTLFMLLEGPAWRRRLTDLLPEGTRAPALRIGSGIYKAVGGFVTGNLLASLLAGVVSTVLLLLTGVPYALPLGLFVVIIELVPYIGPVVVTLLLTAVALTQGLVAALVVFGVLLAYHLVEGHTVRPLIYGRALKLSALAVIIAILLGTEMAGILGALAAIPIAGGIQVIITELLRHRELGSATVPRSGDAADSASSTDAPPLSTGTGSEGSRRTRSAPSANRPAPVQRASE